MLNGRISVMRIRFCCWLSYSCWLASTKHDIETGSVCKTSNSDHLGKKNVPWICSGNKKRALGRNSSLTCFKRWNIYLLKIGRRKNILYCCLNFPSQNVKTTLLGQFSLKITRCVLQKQLDTGTYLAIRLLNWRLVCVWLWRLKPDSNKLTNERVDDKRTNTFSLIYFLLF